MARKGWKLESVMLERRIKESGIERAMFGYSDFMEKIYSTIIESQPTLKSDQALFLARRECVRKILEDELIWLNYWLTDKANHYRIEEVHHVAWEFIKNGFSALPDKYKREGTFRYNPKWKVITDNMGNKRKVDINTQLIMIPRGMGKSVMFHVQSLIRELIIDPKSKWLMTHGNIEKAALNLRQLKEMMVSPWLACVMPELFCNSEKEYVTRGGVITNDKINLVIERNEEDVFDEYASNVRREDTFTIGSLGSSKTGLHFDGQYDDDLATEETTKTEDWVNKTIDFYRKTFALANTPGIYPRRMTGTQHYSPNVYDHILDEITCFCMPGVYRDNEGKKHFLSKSYDDEVIETMKVQFGYQFAPNILMQGMSRDINLKLVNNNNFLFCFKGENAPEGIERVPYTDKKILDKGCVVTSKDPSYSFKSKGSCDSTATGVILPDGKLYVIHEESIVGAKDNEEIDTLIYGILEHQVRNYGTDVFIQDSQGTQKVLAQLYYKRLLSINPKIKPFYYTKGSNATKSKAERAQLILSELFDLGKIRVHWKCERMIAEITRTATTMDFLDVLIQISTIGDFNQLGHNYARMKKNKSNDNNKIKSRPISNKYTNY